MRTIIIGDLHGCYDITVRMLKELQVTPRDWVIFTGDYVDRGPDNDKCCDLVREREQIQGRLAGILGNHEEKHIDYEDVIAKKGKLDTQNMPPTHVATRMQLKQEHYDWFRSLPLYVRVPEHNAAVVHAGVYPGRKLEEQEAKHLLHAQMIQPYDKWGNPTKNTRSLWPSRVPDNEEGWGFWTRFWDGPETIVFGHSVLDRPLVTPKAVGVDLGAVFGRQLCAYVLPEKKLVTLDATVDFGKGRRGRGKDRVKMFEIQDGVQTFS